MQLDVNTTIDNDVILLLVVGLVLAGVSIILFHQLIVKK